MDFENKIIAAIWICMLGIAVAVVLAFGVWAWRDADDRRDCRRAGGVVTNTEHDWHCVGATPERGGQ